MRYIEVNELRQLVQQLQQRLERVEASGRDRDDSYRGSDGETYRDDDEEYNPFHDNHTVASSDEEALHQRHTRRNQKARRAFNLKADIPVYEGRIQPDEFIDWLNTVERVFEYQDVPEEEKVKIVAIKLKKHASIWWEQLKMKRAREGKQKIRTWEKMVKELRKKFLPEGYLQEAFMQLHGFVQGDKTVADYTEELDHLMLKCGVVEPEEQTIARYLRGLRKEIHDVVTLQPFISYHDVFKLATKVEKQFKEKEVRKSASFGGNRTFSRGYSTNQGSSSQSAKPTATKVAQPPAKVVSAGPSRSTSKTIQCYRCKGYGHIMSECPNQRVFTIVEEPLEEEHVEFDSPPIFDEPTEHEDVIYGDTGEMLVIRRALNSSPVQDDVWLRNNIFHTRCTSHGNVCDVIIDSGSCENVVSETMVQKLPLKTEKHPKPYKLSWLQKGKSVQVDQRCLVNFSIGEKYRDEVWCDVVSMDACHLLLGRPWQFDRKVYHDGFKNTYSFEMNGVKIILGPSKMDMMPKPALKDSNFILSKSEFAELFEESQIVFALMVKEVKQENQNIPELLEPLLEQFRNLVPDEIPAGLPPMRSVQHCIDLVPSAILPNKAAYRMNPKENAELQRQVNELLSKGLVR